MKKILAILGNTSQFVLNNCDASMSYPYLNVRSELSGLSPFWQPDVFMSMNTMYNALVVMHEIKNEQLIRRVANPRNNEQSMFSNLSDIKILRNFFMGLKLRN